MRVVQVGGPNLTFLVNNKVTDKAYYCNRLGYNMVCLPSITTDSGEAQGGVSLVVWDRLKE